MTAMITTSIDLRPDWIATEKRERVRIILEAVERRTKSDDIAALFSNCTGAKIRRFASEVRIKLKTPRPDACGAAKKPCTASSEVVRDFFGIIDVSKKRHFQIATEAGLHAVTLTQWKRDGASPRLKDFENAARTLGYRLALVPTAEAAE